MNDFDKTYIIEEKKKILTGTFYPLTYGETLKGYDHYNYKLPLTDFFNIKTFCYNSEGNFTVIDKRTEFVKWEGVPRERWHHIMRLNERGDDFGTLSRMIHNSWTPDLCNFHGGNTGQKGTARRLIEEFKNSNIKFGLEYGGGFDKNSMMTHYYNERADYVILNHELWRQFFPDDYQKKIVITPFNQSVNSNRFVPKPEIEKVYDVMTLGRYDGGNKGHGILYQLFNNESVDGRDIKVLLMGDDIPFSDTKNVVIKSSDYDHNKIVDVLNSSKIFAWGTRKAIENPFCIHVRVIAEALSCGLPVVAFKDSFIESNLVVHKKTGLLAQTDEEFKSYTRMLLRDKDLYNDLSTNARKVAEQADVSTFLKFYKDLWNNTL